MIFFFLSPWDIFIWWTGTSLADFFVSKLSFSFFYYIWVLLEIYYFMGERGLQNMYGHCWNYKDDYILLLQEILSVIFQYIQNTTTYHSIHSCLPDLLSASLVWIIANASWTVPLSCSCPLTIHFQHSSPCDDVTM